MKFLIALEFPKKNHIGLGYFEGFFESQEIEDLYVGEQRIIANGISKYKATKLVKMIQSTLNKKTWGVGIQLRLRDQENRSYYTSN